MKALIIDDNEDIAELYSLELTLNGHEVDILTNPDHITYIDDLDQYDFAMVDFMMPSDNFTNGLEVARYLERSGVKEIVMITALSSLNCEFPVMRKPFAIEDLRYLLEGM